ncbi:unnamed protein product [Ranitomeya imitator]|uniref:NADH dehydrogenase [ubiquinone] 1 alpha subcomplex subunit 12 n=1 Tax=Ranitomeya imitator TaxID=111125 RepID=A0ABN9M1J0_9NEOB|nr:unnamed protein product [Ranitomeya imitator]
MAVWRRHPSNIRDLEQFAKEWSQIPAEHCKKLIDGYRKRHRWLHCMTEEPPTTHPPTVQKYAWENHKANLSATPGQYVPYTTTRKKIEEWVPPVPSKN